MLGWGCVPAARAAGNRPPFGWQACALALCPTRFVAVREIPPDRGTAASLRRYHALACKSIRSQPARRAHAGGPVASGAPRAATGKPFAREAGGFRPGARQTGCGRPTKRYDRWTMAKIRMTTPLVEMDGDEMTRIILQMIKD